MSKNIKKRVADITMPEEPTACLGNEEGGFECCDEFDRFLKGLPEFDPIDEEKFKDIELPPPSKRHKIRMNRLFRERVGGSFLPFPEVDCFYERVRSKIVVKLKINEFLDKREERRRMR